MCRSLTLEDMAELGGSSPLSAEEDRGRLLDDSPPTGGESSLCPLQPEKGRADHLLVLGFRAVHRTLFLL